MLLLPMRAMTTGRYIRFTQQEAGAKVGVRVRTLSDLPAVPAGATGRVIAYTEVEPAGFDVIIEWDTAGRGRPVRDYFTRDEFERLLSEF